MSKYREQTTNLTDKECLINALVEAGYAREVIEVHDVPQQLFDYHGQATTYIDKTGDKANIIIRRNHIGYTAANDLGFRWDAATKSYKAVVSAYDSSNDHWGPDSKRMTTTEQTHAQLKVAKTLKREGFKFLGMKVVNGKKQAQYLDLKA